MENCYTVRMKSSEELTQFFEGTGHLSVGSMPGTYHSKIYAFLRNNELFLINQGANVTRGD